MSFFPSFKWEMPGETKAQQPQFFYVSRDQVTAAFNWSSRKFKLRLPQPQETREHKQALEKWLLKDVTTLNSSALQNGNCDCSRYWHTRLDDVTATATPDQGTGRAQLEPSQDRGTHLRAQETKACLDTPCAFQSQCTAAAHTGNSTKGFKSLLFAPLLSLLFPSLTAQSLS